MAPSDSIQIYAAGSFCNVLPALVSAFSAISGVAVATRRGPAGLLRERIEQGDRPDLFLSASFNHPARLAELGLSMRPRLAQQERS